VVVAPTADAQAMSMLAYADTELSSRYEPAQMTALGIYPGSWRQEDRDWLLESFGELRDFFEAAAARGSAVITCLV
jgi:Domain of unknown function (DUF1877)